MLLGGARIKRREKKEAGIVCRICANKIVVHLEYLYSSVDAGINIKKMVN